MLLVTLPLELTVQQDRASGSDLLEQRAAGPDERPFSSCMDSRCRGDNWLHFPALEFPHLLQVFSLLHTMIHTVLVSVALTAITNKHQHLGASAQCEFISCSWTKHHQFWLSCLPHGASDTGSILPWGTTATCMLVFPTPGPVHLLLPLLTMTFSQACHEGLFITGSES